MNRKPKGSEDPLNRWYFSGGLEDCQNGWLSPINQSVGLIVGQVDASVLRLSLTNDVALGPYFSASIGGDFFASWAPVVYAQSVIAGRCVRYAHPLAYLLVCEAIASELFGFFLFASHLYLGVNRHSRHQARRLWLLAHRGRTPNGNDTNSDVLGVFELKPRQTQN